MYIRQIVQNVRSLCLVDFYTDEAKCGTSSKTLLTWLLRILYTLYLGLRKGSKYLAITLS